MDIVAAQKGLETVRDKLTAIESDLAEKKVAHDAAETEYAETYAKYSDLKTILKR